MSIGFGNGFGAQQSMQQQYLQLVQADSMDNGRIDGSVFGAQQTGFQPGFPQQGFPQQGFPQQGFPQQPPQQNFFNGPGAFGAPGFNGFSQTVPMGGFNPASSFNSPFAPQQQYNPYGGFGGGFGGQFQQLMFMMLQIFQQLFSVLTQNYLPPGDGVDNDNGGGDVDNDNGGGDVDNDNGGGDVDNDNGDGDVDNDNGDGDVDNDNGDGDVDNDNGDGDVDNDTGDDGVDNDDGDGGDDTYPTPTQLSWLTFDNLSDANYTITDDGIEISLNGETHVIQSGQTILTSDGEEVSFDFIRELAEIKNSGTDPTGPEPIELDWLSFDQLSDAQYEKLENGDIRITLGDDEVVVGQDDTIITNDGQELNYSAVNELYEAQNSDPVEPESNLPDYVNDDLVNLDTQEDSAPAYAHLVDLAAENNIDLSSPEGVAELEQILQGRIDELSDPELELTDEERAQADIAVQQLQSLQGRADFIQANHDTLAGVVDDGALTSADIMEAAQAAGVEGSTLLTNDDIDVIQNGGDEEQGEGDNVTIQGDYTGTDYGDHVVYTGDGQSASISGGAGDDQIFLKGNNSQVQVDLGSGSDTLTVGNPNDFSGNDMTIYGDGSDTVVLEGEVDEWLLNRNADGSITATSLVGENTVTINGVENIVDETGRSWNVRDTGPVDEDLPVEEEYPIVDWIEDIETLGSQDIQYKFLGGGQYGTSIQIRLDGNNVTVNEGDTIQLASGQTVSYGEIFEYAFIFNNIENETFIV